MWCVNNLSLRQALSQYPNNTAIVNLLSTRFNWFNLELLRKGNYRKWPHQPAAHLLSRARHFCQIGGKIIGDAVTRLRVYPT